MIEATVLALHESLGTIGVILEFIILIAIMATAGIYLFSRTRKQETDEVRQLADTRGLVISDLRAEVESLRREVAELRGALNAVQDLKTAEIASAAAEKTAERLLPFLIDHPSRTVVTRRDESAARQNG